MYKYFLLLICLPDCISGNKLLAQDDAGSRFGKVSPQEFSMTSPVVDSTADAVVLADIGSAELKSYEFGFRVEFTRFRRIRIQNSKGLDAAKLELYFSAEDNGSGRLKSLKANTYNLVEGKVVQTPVKRADFFMVDSKSDLQQESFAFPDAKVGSIIEYTYTVKSSNIYRLHPWDFQCQYPVIWSEYSASFPDLFDYAVLFQGRNSFYLFSQDSVSKEIWVNRGNMQRWVHTTHCILKDVPAMREEPFVSTISNYIAGVRFQLITSGYGSNQLSYMMDTWGGASVKLLFSGRFGSPILRENHWLDADTKRITEKCGNELEKAKKIFSFVRDSFVAEGDGVLMRSDFPLEEIYRTRKGSVAEINLLLTAILRHENIAADPVILSTRSNGLTNARYPVTSEFNYVVVRCRAGDTDYYLDASVPRLGFGKLPLECYNGHARVIGRDSYPVYLLPDSLKEMKKVVVLAKNDQKEGMTAAFASNMGYYGSMEVRNKLVNTSQTDYFKGIAKSLPFDSSLENAGIDSLANLDAPIRVHFDLKFNLGRDTVMYINPMFGEAMSENPFKPASREYPVEMPFASDNTYMLSLEIPAGYTVEELPRSTKFNLSDNAATFEYSIVSDGHIIKLLSRILFNKANFKPEDYPSLRNFYAGIIKKQAEDIVFKKVQ